jgi:CHAT domain-containing protein
MLGCSTRLSKEGTGGDALGLEWALLLAGASSVVTAHWDVPLSSSSEFFLRSTISG